MIGFVAKDMDDNKLVYNFLSYSVVYSVSYFDLILHNSEKIEFLIVLYILIYIKI